jgi:hypothetical protein
MKELGLSCARDASDGENDEPQNAGGQTQNRSYEKDESHFAQNGQGLIVERGLCAAQAEAEQETSDSAGDEDDRRSDADLRRARLLLIRLLFIEQGAISDDV